MQPVKRLILATGLILTCLASFGASPPFLPDSYLRHVKYLASDDLKGRGNGTPELDKAAEYIAAHFSASGVAPAGDEGTYYQKFMLTTGSEVGPGNKLTLTIGDNSYDAVLKEDFVPVGVGDQTSVSGDLVFAGYGISALEYGYDDYQNLKVADKIVLVLADAPREKDPKSPFKDTGISQLDSDLTKAINAKYRGARAILIVQDPLNHPNETEDLPRLAEGSQIDELGICTLRITRSLARRMLDSQKKDLVELQRQIDEKLAPLSFEFSGVQAAVNMDVSRVRKEVRNVVGILTGLDQKLREEAVVLGAHYDHLGRGGKGSLLTQLIGQIHNGADDNASGTAGLIELAAALARDHGERKRTYIFIAFAGEELGLHGSSHWTQEPACPLEKVVAMINMDMIGRSRGNQVYVNWTGTSPVFPKLVTEAAAEAGIEAKTSAAGPSGSDHISFYIKNIPVLFFFSGLHSDYHRPSDDWDKINAAGAVKILDLVYRVATRLNRAEARPLFTKVDTPAASGQSRTGSSGYGAYFGSIPDMGEEIRGVRFADIRPNSPAAKAGLRPRDVLIRFAGKEIQNLEDFTYMLRTHKPGETVEVTVLRDNQPLSVSVTLEVRR